MADLTPTTKGDKFQLYKDKDGNELIRIDEVRLSYAFLGKQREETNEDGTKSYAWSLTAMLPKHSHIAAKNALKGIIERMLEKNKVLINKDRWPLQDGDQKIIEKTQKKDEIAAGHFLVPMREQKNRPSARNARREVLTDEAEIDKVFYSGVWAHVLVRPWYFDGNVKGKSKTYPKRISAGCVGVLFFKDDKNFGGGRVDDADAWGDAPPAAGVDAEDETSTADDSDEI